MIGHWILGHASYFKHAFGISIIIFWLACIWVSVEMTGKVQNAKKSDGYEFKDSKTGKLVRVSADCIVEN